MPLQALEEASVVPYLSPSYYKSVDKSEPHHSHLSKEKREALKSSTTYPKPYSEKWRLELPLPSSEPATPAEEN